MNPIIIVALGILVGLIASFAGIGGGVIMVPCWFSWVLRPRRRRNFFLVHPDYQHFGPVCPRKTGSWTTV